jgi:hypothetical protein
MYDDELYDPDELDEGWADEDDLDYDDTDDRLTAIEQALTGEQPMVPVPLDAAEHVLAEADAEAELTEFEDEMEESLGAIESELGRELTSIEMEALVQGAVDTGWDPADFYHQVIPTDLSNDNDRVDTMASYMDDAAAYQEASEAAADAGGYDSAPVEQ